MALRRVSQAPDAVQVTAACSTQHTAAESAAVIDVLVIRQISGSSLGALAEHSSPTAASAHIAAAAAAGSPQARPLKD